MDNQTAVEDIRWHESPCDWCRGWGFLIDVEEDGATHGVRDLSGRLALPGEYAVGGAGSRAWGTASPTDRPSAAARATRSAVSGTRRRNVRRPAARAWPGPSPRWSTPSSASPAGSTGSPPTPTRRTAPPARQSRGSPPQMRMPSHDRGATDDDDTDAHNSMARHTFPASTPRHAVRYEYAEKTR